MLERFEEDLARVAAELSRPPQRSPRARRATPVGAAAGALVVVSIALAVALASLGGGGAGVASADPLTRAARAALAQPSLFPHDDQYFYVRTEGIEPAGMSTANPNRSIDAVERVITDRWQSAARTSVQRTRIVGLRFRSAADAAYWHAHGGSRSQVGATQTMSLPPAGYFVDVGRGQLTRRQVLALPTTARGMYERLGPSAADILRHATRRERGALAAVRRRWGSLNSYLAWTRFNAIASSFRTSPMPPAVRSAMYGALALIPGVRSVGTARDLLGRRGAAVIFDNHVNGFRSELIFDPATSALLGERQTIIRSGTGFRRGAVVEDLAFLDEAVTNTIKMPRGTRVH